jgi:hypothetical protein
MAMDLTVGVMGEAMVAATESISINRAPVLTLWATIVAERLGFNHDEALTLGRAVAGLNAYSKGKALGIFEPTPKEVQAKRAEKAKTKQVLPVDLLHRAVPVLQTPEGLRALSKEQAIAPSSVEMYLTSKFKDALGPVSAAMAQLADSRDPEELAAEAYRLYEQFRPDIPAGVAGWGASGVLSLATIRKLAKEK